MTIRERDRQSIETLSGVYKGPYAAPVTVFNDQGVWETSTDVIGDYGGDHDFSHQRRTLRLSIINGVQGSRPSSRQYYDVPRAVGPITHHPFAFSPSDLATEALARTNPGRAHVSVPNFIFELKDLLQLLRIQGLNMVELAAHDNLSYQFAIKPMVSDLRKFLNFGSVVNKRIKNIKKLRDHGGLKRRYSGGTYYIKAIDPSKLIGTVPNMLARVVVTTKDERWVTIRWVPNPSVNIPAEDEDLIKYTTKIVLGLDWRQQAINGWNAIPWSWLIDWFSNVGDFIQSQNNSVAMVNNSSVCVMRHRTSRYYETFPDMPIGGWGGWKTLTSASEVLENKQRFVSYPSPFATNLPFLSAKQLSILGSLAILKRRAGGRGDFASS